MNEKDKSEFLRGFLIIIRKNKILTDGEKRMALIIGKYFGFSEEFCKSALDELLENEYISDEVPKFSEKEVAKLFVEETERIMEQLNELGAAEKAWLRNTIKVNNLPSSIS